MIEMNWLQQGTGNHFFQFSQGTKVLVNEIAAEWGKTRLRQIKRALTVAKNVKLRDAQGFYLAGGRSPLLFIDVHIDVHAKGESNTFDDLINAVDERVAALGPNALEI